MVEETIVTAERREANVQRVPISISVLASDQLSDSVVTDTMDLQFHVPGYVFKTNTVLGQPYLRGVGSDLITAGAESSVALYVDGVYQTRAANTLLDLYDVERVENAVIIVPLNSSGRHRIGREAAIFRPPSVVHGQPP